MLRINLEVTETPTRLKQIEEVVVKNTGQQENGQHLYYVYVGGEVVATVAHYRENGALALAELALRAAKG